MQLRLLIRNLTKGKRVFLGSKGSFETKLLTTDEGKRKSEKKKVAGAPNRSKIELMLFSNGLWPRMVDMQTS